MLLGNGVCPPVMKAVVAALVGKKNLKSSAESSNTGLPVAPSRKEDRDAPVPLRRWHE